MDQKPDPYAPIAWNNSNPSLRALSWDELIDGANRATTEWQPHQDCPCGTCQQIRKQNPQYILDQLERSNFVLRDMVRLQDLRIVKLEKLIAMLTKAVGVSEEFLVETYKGVV